MFSETILGSFLRMVFSGSYPELTKYDSALMLASLMLADQSISKNSSVSSEILRVLEYVYGDCGIWKHYEHLPSQMIMADLQEVMKGLHSLGNHKTTAYISGMLGLSVVSDTETKFQQIQSRQFRIFHHKEKETFPLGPHEFICIVGLKGSGKSKILNFLKNEGEEIIEIYRELDNIKLSDPQTFATLPSSINWEDNPLRLILRKRGIVDWCRRRIFLGSLLRQSEIRLLSSIGKVTMIHVSSSNRIRHLRARARGREIEKNASENKMIELDAHRDGFWLGYEQNDLGGLVDLCQYTVKNEENTSLDEITDFIHNIYRKRG